MFCTNCGKKIPDNSRFCTYCGTPARGIMRQQHKSYQNRIGAGVVDSPKSTRSAGTTGCPKHALTDRPLNRRQSASTSAWHSSSSSIHDHKNISRRTALLVAGAIASVGGLIGVATQKGVLKLPFVNESDSSGNYSSNVLDKKGVEISVIARPTLMKSYDINEARWSAPALYRYVDEDKLEENIAISSYYVSDESSKANSSSSDDSVTTVADTNPEGDPSDTINPYGTISEYTVNSDLSNITNLDDVTVEEEARTLLAKNGFAVIGSYSTKYFKFYEQNRYVYYPNFVTTDSILYTYHIYFIHFLKMTEKNYLTSKLATMSEALLKESISQLDVLKGTEWEDAADRNIAFFGVACKLLGLNVEIPDTVSDIVDTEVSNIESASGIAGSSIVGDNVDYSQYIVRGYYENDTVLSEYFCAMMWYGQTKFLQSNEDLDRSAALMTLAIQNAARDDWMAIYAVTSFFAGGSDDNGFCEYYPLLTTVYGDDVSVETLIGDDASWQDYHRMTAEMEPPKISSLVGYDDDSSDDNYEKEKGFCIMGQRFSLDERIFSELIYDRVMENSAGDKRTLPNALDIPATFGMDAAKEILDAEGETDYPNYDEQIESLRSEIANDSSTIWTASLFSQWLYTLNTLLISKGKGYPSFMQSSAWDLKNLQTYMSSYTEIKNDLALYSKQNIAEIGGGMEEIPDDRGYVEPEPELFKRLTILARATLTGLQGYNMISDADISNFEILIDLTEQLTEISKKELADESLTDDEYELIRSYGGQLEHFWVESNDEQDLITGIDAKCYSPALVIDIASNDSGDVLQIATGLLSIIYVVFPIDGELHVGIGAVSNFYQFVRSKSARLTNTEWSKILGVSNGNVQYEELPPMEEWMNAFKCETSL